MKKRSSELLFKLLIFSLPFQLGYHFWPSWSLVVGLRVDYLSPVIYFTDLVVVGYILGTRLSGRRIYFKSKSFIVFFVFALINISIASNQQVAVIKWIRLGSLLLLIQALAREPKLQNKIKGPLSLSLLVISGIAILQFVYQSSLGGIFYFLGERKITQSTLGASLVSFFGRQYLRPYSTFSHPNSLSGFVAVASILVFDKKHAVALFLSFVVLVLTASLNTWIAIVSVVIIYLTRRKFTIKLNHLVPILITFSVALPLVVSNNSGLEESFGEVFYKRLDLANAALAAFSGNPFFGVGLNNFLEKIPGLFVPLRSRWWIQPVHNIYLLLLVEVGLVGITVLYFSFSKAVKSISNKSRTYYAILFVLLTGILDHYWLTLWQNMLLVVLLLALVANRKRRFSGK